MKKRTIFLIITAFILTSIVAGSLGAITVLAWPFSDVSSSSIFYNDIHWLDFNGITHGCDLSGHFCPGDVVTREQMAAFLHRTAGVTVVAGVHILRGAGDAPYIYDYFNNVNSNTPSVTRGSQWYTIDFGFDVTNRYPQCSIDGDYTDTRNAICSVFNFGDKIQVYIWDADGGYTQPAEFYLLLFGN